jgi:hypothetical protein
MAVLSMWLSCAFALVAAKPANGTTDTGFELLFVDQDKAVDECFPLDPNVPLNGSFIITSGGKFGMGSTKIVAIFDSFGKMHKFDFKPDEGKVCYKAKMMDTGFYNESLKENTVSHGILFIESVPPRKKCIEPMCNLMAANDNTYVNNIQLSSGSFCSVTDTSMWTDFDAETISGFKAHTFKDHIKKTAHMAQMGPAHPQRRPGEELDS